MSFWQALGNFLRTLGSSPPASPAPPPAPSAPAAADALGLTHADYAAAAFKLGCGIPEIKAVAEVESSGRGFLPDGRPAILFEAHVFDRLTKGKFRFAPDRFGVALSVPSWDRTLYGRSGAHQYLRLEDAMKLDEKAAVFATSWGTYQIMGFNFASLGFPDVDTFREFISATDTPKEHLDLFVQFILINGLDDELRARKWEAFARQYNGPGYKANNYHTKMAAAYAKHAAAA